MNETRYWHDGDGPPYGNGCRDKTIFLVVAGSLGLGAILRKILK